MTEGPFGFPMPDRTARAVETILRSLPATDHHAYRHHVIARAPTELNPGERSDVSFITTECVDRAGDVVLSAGMDDSEYRLNPIVTMAHAYDRPPVGRCAWRRRVRDGTLIGVKAKTIYPPRPPDWPVGIIWPPDEAFELVRAGLLVGKSIGFLPLAVHVPDEAEVKRNGWGDEVRLVIDRWLLLEYACVSLPANPLALVEAVSKTGTPFTALEEVERAVRRRVAALDLTGVIARQVAAGIDRARGRV